MSAFKPYLLLLVGSMVVLLTGCASFNSFDSMIVPPTLIEKTPLPQPPPSLAARDFYLRMEILVGRDGAVRNVMLTRSSNDSEWDAAALERIKQWKFSPATLDNKPIQMRIIQTAKVVSTVPIMMNLSEIVCPSFSRADSAYALLQKGAPFDSTATVYGATDLSVPTGRVGEVDIHCYSDDIQAELRNLKSGDFTHPLPLGPYFAIFLNH